MTPPDFPRPVIKEGLSPFLLWNHGTACAHGAALACPQCGGAELWLDTVHFAASTRGQFTPTAGLSINPTTGTVVVDDTARVLHAGANQGSMLSIGYWCEDGCRGRIELRVHKGQVFGSLPHEPTFMTDEPQC